MPDTPRRAEAKGAVEAAAPLRERRDRRDMVRLQRMAHADQESENEHAAH